MRLPILTNSLLPCITTGHITFAVQVQIAKLPVFLNAINSMIRFIIKITKNVFYVSYKCLHIPEFLSHNS